MGKALYAFLLSFLSPDNVMTGTHRHQLTLSIGQSILQPRNFRDKEQGRRVENLFIYSIRYSQPNTFFRKPGRRSLEAGIFIGKDGGTDHQVGDTFYPETLSVSQYNQTFMGLSQDIQLFNIGNLYLSAELGFCIKNRRTNRINSQFTFGEKATIGYNFGNLSAEAYIRHFSNGFLTEPNSPQNFYGLRCSYHFE